MSLKFTALFLLFFGQQAFAADCLKTRGAFDIGSEETKLKIAVVDACKNKIKEILVDEKRPINFLENVLSEPKNEFTIEFLLHAASEINEMKALGDKFQVQEWTAVVTSTFRKASNAKESNEKLQVLTRLNTVIIDEKLEAEIGFYGGLSITDTPKEDLVVFDLGGGSAQISFYDDLKDEVLSYSNIYSSQHAKEFLYRVVQKKTTDLPKKDWDPNPVTQEQAYGFFEFYSRMLFSEFQESRILEFSSDYLWYKMNNKNSKFVAIGGVIASGVGRGLTGETSGSLSLSMLFDGIKKYQDKSSEEIGGGAYVQSDMSNLLLTAAYFNVYLLKRDVPVQYADVSLTEGLLIYPNLTM